MHVLVEWPLNGIAWNACYLERIHVVYNTCQCAIWGIQCMYFIMCQYTKATPCSLIHGYSIQVFHVLVYTAQAWSPLYWEHWHTVQYACTLWLQCFTLSAPFKDNALWSPPHLATGVSCFRWEANLGFFFHFVPPGNNCTISLPCFQYYFSFSSLFMGVSYCHFTSISHLSYAWSSIYALYKYQPFSPKPAVFWMMLKIQCYEASDV